ncbi:TfoX/Sxy family protein [Zooshikella harenae]|uniref:TfoX/Sxy family protein n=1 Tax=Zooshikella harenae TaxID=2827238 RepID=A0ABS5Z6Q8_9GAMM|nr:TfoX/Sxy family protein [Zooshikella harenae]MBU2709443.1 TfoX/Sxy family protein [Zooshikella harenae]
MATDLIELKNLGKTSVQWLNAVGIRDKETLEQIGSVEAYRKIKTRGFKVSKVLLYALEGALLDAHWNQLAPDLKAKLIKEAESNGQHQPEN